MASPKRPVAKTKAKPKSKSKPVAKKKAAAKPLAKKKPTSKPSPKAKSRPVAPPASAPAVSPLTGVPYREKVHLPIKGYGRYNAFQIIENLYGKSVPELKQILTYEESHQARRMVLDRINDMIRRATQK